MTFRNIPEENMTEFEVTGILQAHQDGYTGKGIRMSHWETTNPSFTIHGGKVIDPFGFGYSSDTPTHGTLAIDVKRQVAPDSLIIILPSGMTSKGTGSFYEKTVPYIISNGIHLNGASIGGNDYPRTREVFEQITLNGSILATSAGNDGDRGLDGFGLIGECLSVGAVDISDCGDISHKSYSSIGPELDYTAPSGLYVHSASKPSRTFKVEGTSFSYPFFEGQLAITQQMFLENIGRTLFLDEMIAFLDEHLIDLGSPGHDEYYGKGLYVIPKASTINYDKYIFREEKPFMSYPSDLEGHWSKEFIELVNLHYPGTFNGYEDGTMRPDRGVTRGELAKILCNIFKLGG